MYIYIMCIFKTASTHSTNVCYRVCEHNPEAQAGVQVPQRTTTEDQNGGGDVCSVPQLLRCSENDLRCTAEANLRRTAGSQEEGVHFDGKQDST